MLNAIQKLPIGYRSVLLVMTAEVAEQSLDCLAHGELLNQARSAQGDNSSKVPIDDAPHAPHAPPSAPWRAADRAAAAK